MSNCTYEGACGERLVDGFCTKFECEHIACLSFCPVCGSKLTKKSIESEGWVECPKCGEIHVEYYKPLK